MRILRRNNCFEDRLIIWKQCDSIHQLLNISKHPPR